MKFSITNLPDDILKMVNKNNWEKIFNEYMVAEVFKKDEQGYNLTPPEIDHLEYIWRPEFMKKFIKAILKLKR